MNNNSKPPLQFTKLTAEDTAIHRHVYAALLKHDTSLSINEKGKELSEAMRLFCKEFVG